MKQHRKRIARTAIGVVGAGALASATLAPQALAAPDRDSDYRSAAVAAGLDVTKNARAGRPAGANPFLALRPKAPSRANVNAWTRYLESRAAERQAVRDRRTTAVERQAALRPPLAVDEQEPVPGSNDTVETAQPIPQFGTGGRNPRARISGSLDNEEVSVVAARPSSEDDGSIPLARDTGVGASEGFSTTGQIGDGPHGSAGSGSGDFDVYEVAGVAGQTITVDLSTPTGSLDPMVLVVDDEGEFVAFNDDSDGLDSFVQVPVAESGAHYVFVSGFANLPQDPFDSGSGDGAGAEGPYEVSITQGRVDVDVYAVRLRVGDTLGLTLRGGASFSGIHGPRGALVHGSNQNASFIYSIDSPLPGSGPVANDHVADENGWHYLSVTDGEGDYQLQAEVYRPGPEGDPPVQTLFLDFDGARVNTGALFGGAGNVDLSPLRAFLARWRLTNADYRPLVREIVATVEENVRRDLAASGVNPGFRVRILNSLDHADPWGRPNVSRVVVGGTIEESGVPTIGIAQSIDPGNFGQEETALVLLDVLSSFREGFGDASLNFYLRPRSDRVGFVGQAVGNVTAHEAGHFFGNWHVDQFNARANLMDQGGNFPVLYGVGPDGIGGTADDPDVDFGQDVFNPNEGFTGLEDTLSRIAAVLTL